ncbi:MAG: radical SAM protein, partial [Bacteroidia bacterium]|nr:radical SAM protein [Bacteroidia bacterium]
YINDEKAKEIIDSGLDRLIISIDGTTQSTYQSYRVGGKLQKVIDGTKKVVEWKKKLNSNTPHIIYQFLVVKPNEHQISDVYALANELGVDEVKLKTAQVYDYKNGNELIPENEKYSRYKKEKDGTYSYKNKMSNQCWRMWQGSVVTFDGKLVPCCFDKDAENQLGDLQTDNLEQVWNSEEYKNFRTKLLDSRDNIEICKNCSEGTKVWA